MATAAMTPEVTRMMLISRSIHLPMNASCSASGSSRGRVPSQRTGGDEKLLPLLRLS